MVNRLLEIGMCAALALVLAGCSSFEVRATRRYVDENNNYVIVEEGQDEKAREFITTLPNGRTIKDKTRNKIRVTLPNGRRHVMYQRLTWEKGNLFMTDDEEWQYRVLGMACWIYHRYKGESHYRASYAGTLCATESNPLNEKRNQSLHRFSSPSNFKSPTTNSDSSNTKAKW